MLLLLLLPLLLLMLLKEFDWDNGGRDGAGKSGDVDGFGLGFEWLNVEKWDDE